jgi:signal transduction histidine kinase
LGLWVTRGILVKAGGSIRIRSSQGETRHGTCVSVFLPCTFAETTAKPTMGMIGASE